MMIVMYLCAKRLNKLTVTEKNEKNGHKTKQIAKECIIGSGIQPLHINW